MDDSRDGVHDAVRQTFCGDPCQGVRHRRLYPVRQVAQPASVEPFPQTEADQLLLPMNRLEFSAVVHTVDRCRHVVGEMTVDMGGNEVVGWGEPRDAELRVEK